MGFLLAALPILMLGMGGIELAHWTNLRLILGHALMEAARAGATHQAQPAYIAQAFEDSLRMAWPDHQARQRVLRQRQHALGVPWHMQIQQPSRAAFLDHADPSLRPQAALAGQVQIRNNYQAQQHARRLQQGWPKGQGPRSGVDIYEANTLVVTLSWPHRPFLPGLAALMRTLAPLASDARQAQWMAAGFLPFRRHIRLAMHSHPAQWPDLPDGRITHDAGPSMDLTPIGPGGSPTQGDPSSPTPETDASPDPGMSPEAQPEPGAGSQNGPESEATEPIDDPADTRPEAPHPEDDPSLQCGPDEAAGPFRA